MEFQRKLSERIFGVGRLLDYGARYYDARLSRFLSVDPVASEMPSWSPYSYVYNNPLRFIDPDGRRPVEWPPKWWKNYRSYVGGMKEGWAGTSGRDITRTESAMIEVAGIRGMFGRDIVDEVPLVGEAVSLYEGDYVGILVGIIPGGKKLKKAAEGQINKVIKNVDDLIESVGKFKKGKTRVGENTIVGDADDVFNTITEGGEKLESGAVKLSDGRVVNKHTSTSTGKQLYP